MTSSLKRCFVETLNLNERSPKRKRRSLRRDSSSIRHERNLMTRDKSSSRPSRSLPNATPGFASSKNCSGSPCDATSARSQSSARQGS